NQNSCCQLDKLAQQTHKNAFTDRKCIFVTFRQFFNMTVRSSIITPFTPDEMITARGNDAAPSG
ncbi:hypothetical protein, partial [Erwinia amylovora]|uniref:hypothetical protein n=1 Tax=Erwinia amylovora TaxID=552 RepID=UPI00196B1A3A